MRSAFTVLHLIISLVILVVLACILIPAIETVRRASLRMSCQNNLKQIGMSIGIYNSANNHFPPGTMPNAELPPNDRLSFHVAIHPYTEADPLYSKLAKMETWDSPKNVRVMGDYFGRLYQCPEWMNLHSYGSSARAATGHLSVTNYIGVAGLGADTATRPADAPGIGFFGYDRVLKADQVKDGLAHTMMVIETGHEVGPWLRGGPSTVRPILSDAGPLTGDDLPFGGTHFREKAFFRGTVAAGFHVVLADGSVRYVKGDLSLPILTALATIAGNEELPTDW